MDAQNAVEPASTKPPASPKRTGVESEQPRLSTAAKLFGSGKPDLSAKDNTRPHVPTAHPHDDEAGADGNSDAETIVLPGKDGHSPSKIRKIIKHEDKSDTEDPPAPPRGRKHDSNGRRERERERDGDRGADRGERKEKSVSVADNHSDRAASLVKKKKLADKSRAKDGSSGLSSAPASPPQRRRRRSSIANSKSDSETAHVESPRLSSKEKSRLADKVVPHKRKAPRPDSEDDAESRKIRRQRTSGSGLDASRKPHPPPKSHLDTHTTARNRSPSPPPRAHRRSLSTQLPGHSNGLSHKKKRVPAPLQSTDYHSDESSASGSPHPRSSKLRSLATPATAESTISPAKMAPHKKHLDAHGQTFLARACAKGEFDAAKHRLQERPEDIDVADYAGNTPLQIAAINGYVDIVKLLVDAQCNLECVNNDKDTPLIDAVENGHLDVVKVLLAAGVNPRRANAYGQEPLERVSEDDENADEIKRLLEEAKEHMGERRRTSEDHLDHTDARSSHGPDSPRRSPGASSSINAASGRRAATVRATKTSNHLLYMPMDDKTLRQAAARGDEETVTRILQVRDTFDDPESMVAAARGGHDICMQLLLALGKANPDPAPISNNDYSTPMLAAIGQENTKVIRLLLDQNDFDPTRRYKGETYYELARRRRGPNWAEEEHMLKLAYDGHKKSQRGDAKTKSPNRREQDREARRARAELKDESSKAHKRKASSPAREPKKTAKILTSPKEKRRRSNSLTAHLDEQTSPKRGPGRPKKDDRVPTIAISDREASPVVKQPAAKVKRTEADATAASSEGEALKPRRKLISGRELKGDRSQQVRRASMASNTPSLKEPSSPRDESDKPPMAEKFLDRTKALKRDESRDRLSTSGENTGKRHRSSATPPHSAPGDKDAGEAPPKKRRLDVDGKERRPKAASSDDRHLKAPVSRDSSTAGTSASRIRSKSRDDEERRPPKSKKLEGAAEHVRRESGKSISSENSIHVKSEDADVDMPDAPHPTDAAAPDSRTKEKDAEEKKKDAEEKKRSIEERKRLFEEKRKLTEERRIAEEKKEAEKKRHEEEERAKEREKERLRLEEEERKQREEDKRRAEEKRRKEEEEKKLQEEEARKQRELEEERQREEEQERRRVQEAERKRKEEEERKLQEELEIKRQEEEKRLREQEEMRKKEEEEKKAREEEERLRREQLEREAAEELRRKREEEERKELERKQEMERRRLAREAEQRRIRLEQERIRVAKLPALLQWLDGCANPKTPEIAETFRMTQGIRYDCLRPEATGTPEGREQWLLNTQVALLLGEKDLELSRYSSWARIPASTFAKGAIWRLESDRYALTSPALHELGKQLPGYYGGEEPERMGYRMREKLRSEAYKKFCALETFFVKVSDFLYIVSATPHLRKVRITVEYIEIPETEEQAKTFTPRQKWKIDPDADANHGFAPGNKHFLNGELLSVNKTGFSQVSKTPFPEKRVPRRGLLAVSPDDPSYAAICKEQGLHHLIGGGDSPLLPNGVHSSPVSRSANGAPSPSSLAASTREGSSRGHNQAQPMSPSSEPGPAQARPLVNGANGGMNGNAD